MNLIDIFIWKKFIGQFYDLFLFYVSKCWLIKKVLEMKMEVIEMRISQWRARTLFDKISKTTFRKLMGVTLKLRNGRNKACGDAIMSIGDNQ